MATSSGSYVGIDVSKDKLDVAVLGKHQTKQVDNTEAGIAELVEQMQELQPELIVVEATGGYQRLVVDVLFRSGLVVAVVNPMRVRQLARACGLLAKTDKLDAQVLAVFGERVRPRLYEGKDEKERELSGLLVRRRQLEEMLKAEKNRLRMVSQGLQGSVERIIAVLQAEKKRLDEFERKEKMHLYLDGEGNLAYLAGSQWRLDNTMESWKELEFHATREHS